MLEIIALKMHMHIEIYAKLKLHSTISKLGGDFKIVKSVHNFEIFKVRNTKSKS